MAISIEALPETRFSATGVKPDTMEEAAKSAFRQAPEKITIGGIRGENPAFRFWADKAKAGEKLPRGEYFRTHEFIRAFGIL